MKLPGQIRSGVLCWWTQISSGISVSWLSYRFLSRWLGGASNSGWLILMESILVFTTGWLVTGALLLNEWQTEKLPMTGTPCLCFGRSFDPLSWIGLCSLPSLGVVCGSVCGCVRLEWCLAFSACTDAAKGLCYHCADTCIKTHVAHIDSPKQTT